MSSYGGFLYQYDAERGAGQNGVVSATPRRFVAEFHILCVGMNVTGMLIDSTTILAELPADYPKFPF